MRSEMTRLFTTILLMAASAYLASNPRSLCKAEQDFNVDAAKESSLDGKENEMTHLERATSTRMKAPTPPRPKKVKNVIESKHYKLP